MKIYKPEKQEPTKPFQSSPKTGNRFFDNRPEAVQQRKLKETIANSQIVQRAKALHDSINNSPRMLAMQEKASVVTQNKTNQQTDEAILWTQDPATQKVRNTAMALRESSTLFRSVYDTVNCLNTCIDVRVDDEELQKSYQAATKGTDPEGKVGGYFSQSKSEILLSDIHGNITTSLTEEFFHAMQKLDTYSDKKRNSQELDAEAKLFNTVVLQEIQPTNSKEKGTKKVVEDINGLDEKATAYSSYSGNFVMTLFEAASTGSLEIPEGSKAFGEYKKYLDSFGALHSDPDDAYNGKQRHLPPEAFNQAVKLSNEE